MFEMKVLRDHQLKSLRESADLSQVEISKLTGISTTRLSLAENNLLTLSPKEEEVVRRSILKASNARHAAVAKDGDPRFQKALRLIDKHSERKKLFGSCRSHTLRTPVGEGSLDTACAG